jgi:alcohol-forming fatty acyl-CoA reductase
MIHVSSGYVNSYLKEAHEKVYDLPDDPEKVISLVETLSDEALEEVEPK